MKKLFFILSLVCMALFVSCDRNKKAPVNNDDNSTTTEVVQLNPTTLVSTDRQDMYLNHSDNYRWFETCMRLNDFLDEENDGSLAEVVNVFQSVVGDGKTFDTTVFKYQHFSDGSCLKDSISGFWVEDFPLNDEAIQVSYKDAYEKLMATNLPKPHSRYVTLRKQVGPVDCNAQYIFGNSTAQIYVDAVTGEVRDYNPAFGPDLNLGTPLGEWP